MLDLKMLEVRSDKIMYLQMYEICDSLYLQQRKKKTFFLLSFLTEKNAELLSFPRPDINF